MNKTGTQHTRFHIALRTTEQFHSFIRFAEGHEEFSVDGEMCDSNPIKRIYLESDLALKLDNYDFAHVFPNTQWVVALPPILRVGDQKHLNKVILFLEDHPCFSGILVRNLEGLGYLDEIQYKGKRYADHGFYLWNSQSVMLWDHVFSGACLPLELKAGEQHALLRACENDMLSGLRMDKEKGGGWEKLVYGRVPMMYTANCVLKTTGDCQLNHPLKKDFVQITDRMGISFPVIPNCDHCYNTIYNSLPMSLHGELDGWEGLVSLRLDFTLESASELTNVLDYMLYHRHRAGGRCNPPFRDYTTGHEKRGVQ